MKNFIDFEKMEMLSKQDKSLPLEYKIIKLGEECGEVNQEFLGFCKTINASRSASGSSDGVVEEICDVINVAIDILNAMGRQGYVTQDQVEELFNKKLKKWQKKIDARGEVEK